MKKIIITILGVAIFCMLIGYTSALAIPDEALRIRVIANSNSTYDQEIKNIVKDNIQLKLYNLLKKTKGIDEARNIINSNLPNIDNEINNVLKSLNYNLDYDINFGLNYFPSKEYKGVTYDEGYYESLVITLGNGEGDNWWCVLFPPLCLLEANTSEEVEYTSLVKELIEKYL